MPFEWAKVIVWSDPHKKSQHSSSKILASDTDLYHWRRKIQADAFQTVTWFKIRKIFIWRKWTWDWTSSPQIMVQMQIYFNVKSGGRPNKKAKCFVGQNSPLPQETTYKDWIEDTLYMVFWLVNWLSTFFFCQQLVWAACIFSSFLVSYPKAQVRRAHL